MQTTTAELTTEQVELIEDLQDYDGLDYVTAKYIVENY
jgi:hypothetical protein